MVFIKKKLNFTLIVFETALQFNVLVYHYLELMRFRTLAFVDLQSRVRTLLTIQYIIFHTTNHTITHRSKRCDVRFFSTASTTNEVCVLPWLPRHNR